MVWAKKPKRKKIMDTIKMPTVYRNFGADGGLSNILGGYSPPSPPLTPSPSSDLPSIRSSDVLPLGSNDEPSLASKYALPLGSNDALSLGSRDLPSLRSSNVLALRVYSRASQRGPGGPPGVHSAISGGPHKNAMSAHMSASYKT